MKRSRFSVKRLLIGPSCSKDESNIVFHFDRHMIIFRSTSYISGSAFCRVHTCLGDFVVLFASL